MEFDLKITQTLEQVDMDFKVNILNVIQNMKKTRVKNEKVLDKTYI